MAPLTEMNSLKVLHIRQSGPDFKRFPNWGIRNTGGKSNANKRMAKPFSKNRSFPELTENLDGFAQWAFGGNGFRSLQVLVFGDFSYNERYSWGNVLLCRQCDSAPGGVVRKNYRHLTKGDTSEHELLRTYSHVLQACPTDLLLRD
jgi:hypothetical protein